MESWSELLSGNPVHYNNKTLFIYGMALHVLTDTFAHGAYMFNGTNLYYNIHRTEIGKMSYFDEIKESDIE